MTKVPISFTVNGVEVEVLVKPWETLLELLRDELQSLKGQRVEVVEAIRLAAADKDSAPLVPIIFIIIFAVISTTFCIKPR